MDVPANPQPPAPAKKRKVLLVEDESNIASMVQDWLSERYQVVWAADGKSAVQAAVREQPEIILQDINLPDMTGFDVVRIYQKDPKTAGIPVIFLTGQKMEEEAIKFISTEKNVKGYVNKPFKLQAFFDKIEQVLSKDASFVLLEKQASVTPETAQKAQLVRKARQDAEEEANRPPAPPPARPAPAVPVRRRNGLRALVSFSLRAAFWMFCLFAAAVLASEATVRLVEFLTGERISLIPPLAPLGRDGAPAALPSGAGWERDGVTYRTNALGLRDDDLEAAPSTSTFRAFVLGGASVFGQDVPADKTLPERLEERLGRAALFSSKGAYRVINGGLWGLSPESQWAAYEKMHALVKPEVVIWVLADPEARRPLENRLRDMSAWPAQARFLMDHSRFAGLLAAFYLHYRGSGDLPSARDLSGAVNRFMDAHPETTLMVFKLGKEGALEGVKTREKLIMFNIDGLVGLDLSWKGLTLRGHESLAAAVYSSLQKYKDRVVPPGSPALAEPSTGGLPSNPAPGRPSSRRSPPPRK